TELLIRFKHYYAMKRTMIISAGITAFTFITGALFKIMHWPGASAMILLSIVTLCFIFLPILFIFKTKETSSVREKITLAVATVFGIVISLATLFKIMHWPGANIMWLSSLGFLFFIFLPLFFFSGIRKKETKLNTIISSVLILVAIGLLFALTQLRSSKWTDYSEKKADLQLMELTELTRSELNDTVPASDELLSKGSALITQIEELKSALILHMNKSEDVELPDLLTDLGKEINHTNSFFFSDSGQARPLLQKLSESVRNLYSLLPEDKQEKATVLKTEKRQRYGESHEEQITWEEDMFSHVSFSNALRKLNQLELAVACTIR
ncbi:MAG: GldL-related protein, partial [Bacteroidota bacterium]